jgi:ribose-phosphate pyrophosphokinase
MKLIAGSASKKLANILSQSLNIPLVNIESRRFPDGELYVRILEKMQDEDVYIIQTTYPDENIIELFFILDAVKRAGAKSVAIIIPYFGYARQDKQFKEGEPISAAILASLISTLADKVITIDPHKEHILDFFTIPAESISAVSSIVLYLKEKEIDMVLSPDHGALNRAKKAAELLKCDVDYLEKKRIDGNTISISPKNLDVKGRTVAIIDDIISTGGTMAEAIKQLRAQQADTIYVACTHGLFAGSAIEKLQKAGCEEIIATDTIQSPFSIVSVTSVLKQIFM